MKVIISGGYGYIGTNLVKHFLTHGITPTILARSERDYFKECAYIKVDITEDLTHIPSVEANVFIHLAAANDVDSKNTLSAIKGTTLGTKHALEYCIKNKIAHFIYFSTFQIYGAVDKDFTNETIPEPNNDYGITHLFAEEYVKMFARNHGLTYTILRPTNIFGSPLNKQINRWSLVPGCFCKEALEKGTITLLSSGKQVRDFLNLNDISRFTVDLCSSKEQHQNQEIILHSGNQYSILEIAQLTKAIYEAKFKKSCQLKVLSSQPEESNYFSIEDKNLKQMNFSFQNKDSIREEIEKTFEVLLQ